MIGQVFVFLRLRDGAYIRIGAAVRTLVFPLSKRVYINGFESSSAFGTEGVTSKVVYMP